MLLALDTSTPWVSVAVHDGRRVLHAARAERAMQHGEQLAPMLAAALEAAGVARTDLTRIAVGVGPGPFTGLRVGLVTARTLGFALGIPVLGVLSLDVLAARARREGVEEPLVATIDARRKELFWAAYDDAGRRVRGPEVSRPGDVPDDTLVVGAGPVLYPDAFARTSGPEGPDAATLASVVVEGATELVEPQPVYLRRPDAAAPAAPRPVRQA